MSTKIQREEDRVMSKVLIQNNRTRANKLILRNIVSRFFGICLLFLLSVNIRMVTSYAQSPIVPFVVTPLEFGIAPPIKSAKGKSQLKAIKLIEIPILWPTEATCI